MDKARAAELLSAIAAEAKLAEMNLRECRYWDDELERDIEEIRRKTLRLVEAIKRPV